MAGGCCPNIAPQALGKLESAASKQLVDFLVLGKNFECNVYHYTQSCNQRQILKIINVIKSLLKINIPIHVIPMLIYKIKALK